MLERSLKTRSVLALAAALQFAVPAAASWADARLEAEGRVAPVHIESHSTSSCAHVHPPDCGLCHFLSTPLSVPSPRRAQFALVLHRSPTRFDRPALPSAIWRSGPRPRAPPALS